MLTRVPPDLLEKAVSLHGHLGPFLVLGLKMGLKVESTLGKPVACEIATPGRKPFLCVVDGLKTVVGCSVVLREGESLSAWFSNTKGDELVIRVRASVVGKYADKYVGAPWEGCEKDAYEVLESSDEELFEPWASGEPAG
ncbi:MAG: FmdE family protein [Thermoproteota archaeon]